MRNIRSLGTSVVSSVAAAAILETTANPKEWEYIYNFYSFPVNNQVQYGAVE